MNIAKPEDIAEIMIISGRKAEEEVNEALESGWELVEILATEKITFILGKRVEE